MSRPKDSFWSLFPFIVVAVCTLISGVWYYLRAELPVLEQETSLFGNIGFFVLINLNIIFVLVLGFLVVKNLVKLVLDRKRGILGSRLRSRLVVAFVGLSLVPTVLLLIVARGIVGTVLEGWFSPQIAASVDGALNIAQFHYQNSEDELRRQIQNLSDDLSSLSPYLLEVSIAA
jgi:two-component system nitrogen regulation sensor histidine kinase NtrY